MNVTYAFHMTSQPKAFICNKLEYCRIYYVAVVDAQTQRKSLSPIEVSIPRDPNLYSQNLLQDSRQPPACGGQPFFCLSSVDRQFVHGNRHFHRPVGLLQQLIRPIDIDCKQLHQDFP